VGSGESFRASESGMVSTSFLNMAHGRIHTASCFHSAAHALELKYRDSPVYAHIVTLLRKEAEEITLLGLQELGIAYDKPR